MITVKENGMISAREIYNFIEVKSRFRGWVSEALEFIDAKEDKDFSRYNGESTGGRPSIEYDLTIDCAKELCLTQRSDKSKELRRWLINLSNQVENASLVSHQQVIQLVRMVKIFAVYEFRKQALDKNKTNYLANALLNNPNRNKERIYAEFNTWRNEVLKTGKQALSERVKEYCLIERKRIPTKFTQEEALALLGEYEQIKNAVWDLLSSQNKSEETIKNICSLAQELAKEIKPFMERLNESNLFFQKIDDNEIKKVFLK
jgi:phage anti-repressor protein